MKTPLINRAHVKQFALDYSATDRNGRFTRVSSDFYARVEAKLAAIIREEIHRHPSIGVTLK